MVSRMKIPFQDDLASITPWQDFLCLRVDRNSTKAGISKILHIQSHAGSWLAGRSTQSEGSEDGAIGASAAAADAVAMAGAAARVGKASASLTTTDIPAASSKVPGHCQISHVPCLALPFFWQCSPSRSTVTACLQILALMACQSTQQA